MERIPRTNAANFEEKARNVHGEKYDYSKVHYETVKSKVIIICSEHGEFLQALDSHINQKHGCPSCGITKKMTLAEFLEKAKRTHGAMTSHYDYSSVVAIDGSKTKVEIICKLHGSFQMTVNSHLMGKGCSKCKAVFSLAAVAWLEYMARTRGIEIKHALRGGEERLEINGVGYSVDGYCPQLNTVFQYHGDFFHGNPSVYAADDVNKKVGKTFGELYRKTQDIERLIVSKGYKLETIWEKDWKSMCKELNLDPTEACQNPDYECPTAVERNASKKKKYLEKQKQRAESDPEYKRALTETRKKYNALNSERNKQRCREYRAKNKNKMLEYNLKNKDKIREGQARHYAENKDKLRQENVRRYHENKDKQREKSARYREKNKTILLEREAEYRAQNKDKKREVQARYYAKNRDKERERKARYYAENKDKEREKSARYRAENRNTLLEKEAEYRAKNRDKLRENVARHRAKTRNKEEGTRNKEQSTSK